MRTICAFALAALVWSFFGRLDVHAIAQGKIETAGHSKVIEPLDPGKIAAIHVEAGQPVRAGDLLFELDPAEAHADATAAEDALNASLAEIARRRFAIEVVRSAESKKRARPATRTTSRLRKRQVGQTAPRTRERLRRAPSRRSPASQSLDRLGRGDSEVVPPARGSGAARRSRPTLGRAQSARQADGAESSRRRKRLDMSIAFQRTLMDTLNAARRDAPGGDRQAGRHQDQPLRRQGGAGEIAIAARLRPGPVDRDRRGAEGACRARRRRRSRSSSPTTRTSSPTPRARPTKRARRSPRPPPARRTPSSIAPIDGVVQQTAVTTIGQVVTTGQQLAVDHAERRQAPGRGAGRQSRHRLRQARPAGRDQGRRLPVHPLRRAARQGGQDRLGRNPGRGSQAGACQRHRRGQPGADSREPAPGQPESFVFPVTVALDETAMKIDNAVIPLTPGMTVTVEIKTNSRRVIDYLLSPLAKHRVRGREREVGRSSNAALLELSNEADHKKNYSRDDVGPLHRQIRIRSTSWFNRLGKMSGLAQAASIVRSALL